MRDDPYVVALVTRAVVGDQSAWDEIVERYTPLVWSICTRYRLSTHDSKDVAQTVWLLLVEHLGELREPAALPGWLARTSARECLRVATAAHRTEPRGTEPWGTERDDTAQSPDEAEIEREILLAELNATLRAAFAKLPPRCQQLLAMLLADPPPSYAEISARLDIPVGSIGPQRGRCLGRLRKSPALIALVEGDIRVTVPGGKPSA
jgi:RNA polymerase sigma factor (sigma-70 family)